MIRKKEYHLIFMDQFMPVMDGIEATMRLRQMEGDYYRRVPVIALSADYAAETRQAFTKSGMNDYAVKPIDTQELNAKIKRWLPQELVKPERSTFELLDSRPVTDFSGDGLFNEDFTADGLPVIEGIDSAEGVRYSGSKELFINLLGDFYKLIDIKSNKIEKCLSDGMIRDVTVEVHALKTTARMLGASRLSNEFALLEQYGKAENTEALIREVPAVLAHYRSYKEILKHYSIASETEKQPAEPAELIMLLNNLKTSVDNFDLDNADEAVTQLDKRRMPEALQTKMEALRAYVADVAMEDIIALADEMIKALD
jgi:YesN/AraC family two-component response regulator